MARITKADLEARLASAEAENVRLQQELAQLRQVQTKTQVPAGASPGKVAFTVDNPLFDGLERYLPHSRIECPTHGKSQANKIGICVLCACERARGGRIAA